MVIPSGTARSGRRHAGREPAGGAALAKEPRMPFILGALLVVVAIWIFFSFAGSLIHLLLMLAIAGIVGWLADAVVPGRLPWGWLGAILAGLVGSWLGVVLLGL